MKILSWIIPAAAVITTAWATMMPPFNNDANDSQPDALTSVQQNADATPCTAKATENDRQALAAAHARAFAFASYQRCRQHIDLNYERLGTANQVALECHLDADAMKHNFQRYAHQSPDQYLQHMKLMHAGELRHPLSPLG